MNEIASPQYIIVKYPGSVSGRRLLTEIVSETEVSFEGVSRPAILATLHESDLKSPEDVIILERYFADIHNLFLKKLSAFASEGDVSGSGQDAVKLRSLLEEILKVKMLIQKGGVS